MIELADQIFVRLKQFGVAQLPGEWHAVVSILFSILPLLVVFPALFALTTLLERKGLARIQNRYGPNRVGPFGLLQPLADGLKMLTKEDVVPRSADRVLHFLAPITLLVPVLLSFAVLPYGRNMVPVDLDAGILFFFAVGAATELSVFIAGWSSRNKYSLLGAMRAIAQMISYELPLILSTVPVLMLAGSLSLVDIVLAQEGYYGFVPRWFIFTPWGLAGFFLFLVAAAAESNRPPFDLPEAESEIIAGYLMEYSGFKYALFFLGEYLGLFAVSGLAVTLFLGGWQAPLPILWWVPSWAWFFLKLSALIAFFIWVRGTLPRLRMDQLMDLSWKFMVPMCLVGILAAAVWHFAGAWNFVGSDVTRWVVTALLLLLPYWAFSRNLQKSRRMGPRHYRLVEG